LRRGWQASRAEQLHKTVANQQGRGKTAPVLCQTHGGKVNISACVFTISQFCMTICLIMDGPRYRRSAARYARSIGALGLFLLFLLLPALGRADADKIYRENSSAVVVVAAIDQDGRLIGQGSGFMIRADGALVTNYHVVNMASDIKVKVGTKILDVEGLLHVDPENDLAIVKVVGKGYPTVKLGDAAQIQVGERVYVIGSPQGLENSISEGILSGIRSVDRDRKLLQMTAAISPGSSGGPVFNGNGEVIGVATFLIAETQNLNFALPIGLIAGGLSKTEVVSPKDACKIDYSRTAACWFYQGLAYGSHGQHGRAAEAFKQSLAMDAKKIETYINLGISYASLGSYQEAIAVLSEALKMDPDQPEVLSRLGAVYSQQGNYQEAVETLRKSVRLKPDDADTRYNLAITYSRMDRDKEAVGELKETIKLVPKHPDAHGLLAVLYQKMGLYSDAAAEFKSAIRLNPEDARMHFGLGKAFMSLGDKASALDEYKILKRYNQPLAEELFGILYK
jgi:tetratricopeptide (TPR) repeat protein